MTVQINAQTSAPQVAITHSAAHANKSWVQRISATLSHLARQLCGGSARYQPVHAPLPQLTAADHPPADTALESAHEQVQVSFRSPTTQSLMDNLKASPLSLAEWTQKESLALKAHIERSKFDDHHGLCFNPSAYDEDEGSELSHYGGNQYFKLKKAGTHDDPELDHWVAFPTTAGKQVLIDYYRQKYGICILQWPLPLTDDQKDAQYIHQQLDANGGRVGLLCPSPEGLRGDPMAGHVNPVIIEKIGNRINAYSMDSVRRMDILVNYIISQVGAQATEVHVYINQADRQADKVSCHTDGLVVLKDALSMAKAQDKAGQLTPFSALLAAPEALTADRVNPLENQTYFQYAYSVPEKFLKTAQKSKALAASQLPGPHIRAATGNPHAFKHTAIDSHRARYTRLENIAEPGQAEQLKARNHFLTLKSFANAYKIIDLLKQKESAS